ncbi:MAG TPA: diguanylate cyclase [Steroidobacteraceae bacterium]|nr:diguanylate cyclase [Steroidobacteraceae bacterium]
MKQLPQALIQDILRLSPEGITVCERTAEGWVATYVNPAFERLTGYRSHELLGRDLRLLQAEDREQDNRQRIRQALTDGQSCRALLRNYRNDGSPFWNEFTLEPVSGPDQKVTHFVGFHRDASERLRFEPKPAGREATAHVAATTPSLLSVLRDDRLTGLYNRTYFDELYRRDFAIAQREGRRIALLVLDIDALGAYNDTFGKAAGDSCVKRVARTIAGCLRRGSDLVARMDGGTMIAMVHGMTSEQLLPFANTVLERVREMRIHHPKSTVLRYVTVSAGVLSAVPAEADKPEQLIEKAQAALKEAKNTGRNRVVAAR